MKHDRKMKMSVAKAEAMVSFFSILADGLWCFLTHRDACDGWTRATKELGRSDCSNAARIEKKPNNGH